MTHSQYERVLNILHPKNVHDEKAVTIIVFFRLSADYPVEVEQYFQLSIMV